MIFMIVPCRSEKAVQNQTFHLENESIWQKWFVVWVGFYSTIISMENGWIYQQQSLHVLVQWGLILKTLLDIPVI